MIDIITEVGIDCHGKGKKLTELFCESKVSAIKFKYWR
jgi:hypothetical protein